jgi:hypothetical protein
MEEVGNKIGAGKDNKAPEGAVPPAAESGHGEAPKTTESQTVAPPPEEASPAPSEIPAGGENPKTEPEKAPAAQAEPGTTPAPAAEETKTSPSEQPEGHH